MLSRIQFAGLFCLFFSFSSALAGSLHDDARTGDIQRLKQALDQGAKLEARDGTGETPLYSAAVAGQSDIVEMLIKRGADVQARNGKGLTLLHVAAYGGQIDLATLLINSGADVNDSKNRLNTTPLHLAAEENQLSMVDLLVAQGAKIDAEEMNGYAPITQAGWREHWDVVSALKKAGAPCQPEAFTGEWLYSRCEKLKP